MRYNAFRSLRQSPSFNNLEYDFVGTADHRRESAEKTLQQWKADASLTSGAESATVLIGPDGDFRWSEFERLKKERDDRPVNLAE